MHLHTGYEFLEVFIDGAEGCHTKAQWLLCAFENHIWSIKTFQQNPITVDWRVALWDGTTLTDEQNETLLKSLKHLMIMSVEGMTGEFATLSPESKNHRLKCSMRAIDYLLIHAKEFKILEHGLGSLDGDDLKHILNNIASSSNSENTIYDWKNRCCAFFRDQVELLTDAEAAQIFATYPAMIEVSEDQIDESDLDFPIIDIPKLRAALMKSGLYYRNNQYGLAVNTKKLSNIIYPDTLRGKDTQKSTFYILSFFPNEPIHKREYPAMPVTTGSSDRLQDTYYFYYRYFFVCTAALEPLKLPAPADVDSIKKYMPKVAEAARFRSVPSKTLLELFRKSMEFHIQHGRKVLDGFVSVAQYCHEQNISMHNLSQGMLSTLVGPELVQLGVKKLGLSSFDSSKHFEPRKAGRNTYYDQLRSNQGLLELVHVYIGCVQLIVGMIMARRVDELITLKSEKCLDPSCSWLIFEIAKSTRHALGLRQRESRPIDAIAVEMIEEIRRFQIRLKNAGVIKEPEDLFAAPYLMGHTGLNNASRHQYNQCLDFACDYFETTVTPEGKRYYVRQHQLRRFFAMMFFYTNSFGDLDTLRWMLGHRDVEHVWRYLQECLSEKEIMGAGARYFAEIAKKDRLESYQNLRDLLELRFGTKLIHLVDEQEIEDYLEAILEQKKASIDYHFFKDENGISMRILFIVN